MRKSARDIITGRRISVDDAVGNRVRKGMEKNKKTDEVIISIRRPRPTTKPK